MVAIAQQRRVHPRRLQRRPVPARVRWHGEFEADVRRALRAGGSCACTYLLSWERFRRTALLSALLAQGKVGTALLCFSYLVREEAKSVDEHPQRVAAVYDKYGRALQASGDLSKSARPACMSPHRCPAMPDLGGQLHASWKGYAWVADLAGLSSSTSLGFRSWRSTREGAWNLLYRVTSMCRMRRQESLQSAGLFGLHSHACAYRLLPQAIAAQRSLQQLLVRTAKAPLPCTLAHARAHKTSHRSTR